MITYDSEITENSIHNFTAFASDLYNEVPDLQRGFPRVIETNMGNKQPFVGYSKKVNEDGDVLYVRYRQEFGCIEIKIFND